MKSSLAILFLVLYLLALLRPVAPVIEYVLNQEYIAKNLCINRDIPDSGCHGKCYLKDQVAKATQDDFSSEKAPVSRTDSEDFPVAWFQDRMLSVTSSLFLQLTGASLYSFDLKEADTDIPVPPPRFLC